VHIIVIKLQVIICLQCDFEQAHEQGTLLQYCKMSINHRLATLGMIELHFFFLLYLFRKMVSFEVWWLLSVYYYSGAFCCINCWVSCSLSCAVSSGASIEYFAKNSL